jgi:trans-aconitate methyltransferase
MAPTHIRDKGQPLGPPTGKLLGIVESRANLESVAANLRTAEFETVDYLHGDEGVALLERVDGFFFSDMEDRVLARHIEELRAGHAIIAVKVPPDRVEEATQIASQQGARRLVYFGLMTITWLTK